MTGPLYSEDPDQFVADRAQVNLAAVEARIPSPRAGGAQPPGRVSTAEVALASGTTYRMVDYWCRKGWVQQKRPAPGTGYQRSWDLDDALRVAVLAELARAGVQPHAVPLDAVIIWGTWQSGRVTVMVDVVSLRADLARALGLDGEVGA